MTYLPGQGFVLPFIFVLNTAVLAFLTMTVVVSSLYLVGKVRKIGLEL